MFVRMFFFVLPFCLVAQEFVWSSNSRNYVSGDDYEKAIRIYVNKKYPQQAKAYRKELFKKIQQENEQEIRDNTVIVDGLMWQDNEDIIKTKRNWHGAKRYCQNLKLFGFDDWYLPDINELKSIVASANKPTIKSGFNYTALSYYWSSTTNRGYTKDAWRINFANGFCNHYYKGANHYVRCVRRADR